MSLQRLAAGAILLSARRAKRAMLDAAADPIAQAQVELEKEKRAERAALAFILLAAGKNMADALTVAITGGRHEARKGAARRLDAELKAAGAARLASVRPLTAAAAMTRASEDAAHASIAAESLASQWRGLALASATAAERRGKSLSVGLEKTNGLLRPRIDRTATTEVVDAYNSEHRELVREALKYGDLAEDVLVREWSAAIDACERCWPHHGEQTDIDDSFSGGDEPGSMHPRCRCFDVIVPATGRSRIAA